MLGEAARIDEATEPRDLGGVAWGLLEHALRGEDPGLDEELLWSDPEGRAKATLQLSQRLPADPRDLVDHDRSRKVAPDDLDRPRHGLKDGQLTV
jgi:hypothetical protein